jgi:hypothetical protein
MIAITAAAPTVADPLRSAVRRGGYAAVSRIGVPFVTTSVCSK